MAKKIRTPKWVEEFKTFAIKGNAMTLAVGVIIGGAFQSIVKSLTDDVIMPIVSVFLGGIDFSQLKLTLPRLFGEKLDEAGEVIENTLNYGNFISSIINFFNLALGTFWRVRVLNKLSEIGKKKEEPVVEAPPAPSDEVVLLSEIRDLLKKDEK